MQDFQDTLQERQGEAGTPGETSWVLRFQRKTPHCPCPCRQTCLAPSVQPWVLGCSLFAGMGKMMPAASCAALEAATRWHARQTLAPVGSSAPCAGTPLCTQELACDLTDASNPNCASCKIKGAWCAVVSFLLREHMYGGVYGN